jgi:hypothetical protein
MWLYISGPPPHQTHALDAYTEDVAVVMVDVGVVDAVDTDDDDADDAYDPADDVKHVEYEE